MKKKLNSLVFFSVIIIFLLDILSFSTISAADKAYNIRLVDTDYRFLKTVGSDNVKFNYYTIIIKLKNIGAEESDEIRLEIWEKEEDENLSVGRNATIKTEEIMEFRFENWMVYDTGEHTVMYKYYPTELSKMDNFNSGAGSFKINDGSTKTENNSPGFEMILVLLAFVFIYFLKKELN